MPIQQVRTRDNHVVPFDLSRIVDSIVEAMAHAGAGDRDLADELAAAVCHFLENHHRDPVGVDAIHDMVEKVLMETGQREIARAYVLLREKRARQREQLKVRDPESGSPEPQNPARVIEGVTVEARGAHAAVAWDRGRITRALLEEADLDAEVAENISESVEERGLRSGLKSISSALVRELVDNELFERGLTARLQRQSPISVPKYDLERALFHGGAPHAGLPPGDPSQVVAHLGQRIVREYVLQEVYSKRSRDAHRDGRLHLHQLEDALGVLRVALHADSVPLRGRGRAFTALFRHIRRLCGEVTEEIEVSRLGEALLADRDATREEMAFDFGEAVLDFAMFRREHPRNRAGVTLKVPVTPRFASERTSLFDELAEETSLFLCETLYQGLQLLTANGDIGFLARAVRFRFEISAATFREPRYAAVLEGLLRHIPMECPVAFTVVAEEEEHAESESDSIPPTSASEIPLVEILGGKVTLNLPRVAFELRRGRIASLEEGLAELLDSARGALAERLSFLHRLSIHPHAPLARVLSPANVHGRGEEASVPRVRAAIGLVGFDEAITIATGRSRPDAAANRAAREWVAALEKALGELPAGTIDARLVLEETPSRAEAGRMEGLDRQRFDGDHFWSRCDRGYSSGIRYSNQAPLDPLAQWRGVREEAGSIHLLDRLDRLDVLRTEGVEVLMAFLEDSTVFFGETTSFDDAAQVTQATRDTATRNTATRNTEATHSRSLPRGRSSGEEPSARGGGHPPISSAERRSAPDSDLDDSREGRTACI